MSDDTNNFDPGQLDDTNSFLRVYYPKLVKKSELPEQVETYLLAMKPFELDELELAYNELVRCITSKEYYKLLSRIEKAETVIDQEKDMKKRSFYVKKMRELAEKLEGLGPAAG